MAAKFSMVNTSGLFDSAAHVEASDRMQGAMEELKIKNERQERAKAAQQQRSEKQNAEQKRRLQRSIENARANAAASDASFIRAKKPNENQRGHDDDDDDDLSDDDDYDSEDDDDYRLGSMGAIGAKHEEDDSDDDALLDGLDMDPELERLRAVRLAQLKKQFEQKQELLAKGHGEYREIVQDEFLKEVTSSPLVLVHFYHRDFERCKIMDMHLTRLAKRHIECKFLKINAEKTPFFVEKLAVRVLPSVIGFKDGVAFPERLIGFDGLTADDEEEEEADGFGTRVNYRAKSTDSFPTIALARKLVKIGVINYNDADEDEEA